MKVSELQDRTPVDDITLEITDIEEPRDTSYGPVQNASAKDDTGDVQLTLWNEQVNQYGIGDKVKITKGWCKSYQGKLQVSAGKFGALEKLE
ncbi:MAG: OB-fold nucleic acid binding domain-containing protein [Candidatus Altiarchaeota archaeon]